MIDRLNPVDASFFYLEDATTPMHMGGVAIFKREPPTTAGGRRPPADNSMTHLGGVKRHSHQYSSRDDTGTAPSRRSNERSARTAY